MKIRQEKYNEAFDVLSRSATIDPDKANTQFFLAQALIQQGNRGPAECGLRRAIQLKPGWGEPHYMLAVLYATQEADTLGLCEVSLQAGGHRRSGAKPGAGEVAGEERGQVTPPSTPCFARVFMS